MKGRLRGRMCPKTPWRGWRCAPFKATKRRMDEGTKGKDGKESFRLSPSVTPKRSALGTKTSATGASAANSGGDIGFRCGICERITRKDTRRHLAARPMGFE